MLPRFRRQRHFQEHQPRQAPTDRIETTMLTDYHVHLRPDEPGTTAELFFTPRER